MVKHIKSYMKYGDKCGIAKQVEGKVVEVIPHPKFKGLWQFEINGEKWMCSNYAFDEE